MTIHLRRASEKDAEAILRLSAELGYPGTLEETLARLRSVLASQSDLLLVAADKDGRPVGWLQVHAMHLMESGLRAQIVGLVVAHDRRRQGVGRKLVEGAEAWALEIGASMLVVRSNIQRMESHVFYPAIGFTRTKTQHVYHKPIQPSVGR